MNQLYQLIIIPLSAYSFATAVQMSRGVYLNFKPFNCKFCLSFWFSLFAYIILGTSVIYSILCAFYVAFVAHFLKILEDKLLESKFEEPDLTSSSNSGGQNDTNQN